MAFALTPKQAEATLMLGGSARHCALWGGSRSGKTFTLVRATAIRALKASGSRHLIARLRKNHVVASIGRDTFPKVMELCFPNVPYQLDRSEWFATFPNKSEIWLGGLDDKQRVEKILGTEFATVYLNECSQIPYASVTMIRTRLAQKTALVNRMYYDLNPTGTGHYAYKLFVEKVDPTSRAPLRDPDNYVSMAMNPGDNLANLPATYLDELEALPERQRQRFLLGRFSAELENALWTYDSFVHVPGDPHKLAEGCERVVVAVDPSGAAGQEDKRSDEIGIMVVGRKTSNPRKFIVLADLTMRGSPHQWARAAINAYHAFKADTLICERNFGGAMVTHTIRSEDRNVPVKEVVASRGKVARAEPVATLYSRREVEHVNGLTLLEDQMLNMTTAGYMGDRSPDRVDSLVWGLSDLSQGSNFSILGVF